MKSLLKNMVSTSRPDYNPMILADKQIGRILTMMMMTGHHNR